MFTLFETTTIHGMKRVNRFVRSATREGMAMEKGECTSRLIEIQRPSAEGKVGLIITSHAHVRRTG